MFIHEVKGVRVRYADTDQMGYVYYGNYARYYEIGRVEALRSLDFHYKVMEDEGVMMPVYENRSRYIKPARYDDELNIRVTLQEMPGIRVVFHYEIRNQLNLLLNTGETTLVFQRRDNGKLCMAPEKLLNKLRPYFEI
ncbi:acyl-CoA thioesterase [Dyadobacter fanqingshengii]|uniref:Acyl-CoA thioesterase n=1 Tax=Dyadobacter fanqingshengii TaxID=2906443 RepID=A0A9X1T8H0_9BACT|nr:thioesterase family protein [Dyadobacter fanqingshengii]MCF0039498.1 acyl-CoA thioesterase [Dyadobacter fanqingshengii]USJ33693.1 acyl-CoA thioesterase [Dyadobacter fanqingshengii]